MMILVKFCGKQRKSQRVKFWGKQNKEFMNYNEFTPLLILYR